jgi:hypothetical protein
MGWNPEMDPQRKGSNNPEIKPEHPPKQQNPSEETLRRLGSTAIKGPGQK